MFPTDYNPMMESPPNANALEVPQHQILNLSQPQVIPNSLGVRTTIPSHPAPASNFPPDIATILNEPSDTNQFRPASLREGYGGGGASDAQPGVAGGQREGQIAAAGGQPAQTDDADADREKKNENLGEDTRFMTRTYNLLTASQDDLGEMMDEYNLYPE